MQLPNLPTDNLYKFISLFGIAIVVLSIFLFYSKVRNLYDAFLEEGYQEWILKGEVKDLEEDAKNIEDKYSDNILNKLPDSISFKIIEEIDGLNPKQLTHESWVFIKKYYETRQFKSHKDLMQRASLIGLIEHGIKQNNNVIKINELKKSYKTAVYKRVSKEQAYKKYANLLCFLFTFGIVVSIIGFILWYNLIQKYEDRILKRESEITK